MSIIKAIKDKLQGIPGKRNPKWPTVRKHFLKANPMCAVCGGTEVLEVHHIIPFNIDASLELEPTNLITLCESKKNGVTCHLLFGHCGNYKSFNKSVEEDAKLWYDKINSRPGR